MNNVYRISGEEMCETCIEKDRRVHELEMHDQDEGELKTFALAAMNKLFWLGLVLCVVGGGSAMLGNWALESIGGVYGKIAGATIWLFGIYMFSNSIFITAKYYRDKETLKNRLDDLRHLRTSEIVKLKKKLRESEKKEKESGNHG